jgi:hypothetical protein
VHGPAGKTAGSAQLGTNAFGHDYSASRIGFDRMAAGVSAGMDKPEATPGQRVVAIACWSCDTQLYKTVPRRRRGPGHVLWVCDCGVAWSSPSSAGAPEAA